MLDSEIVYAGANASRLCQSDELHAHHEIHQTPIVKSVVRQNKD